MLLQNVFIKIRYLLLNKCKAFNLFACYVIGAHSKFTSVTSFSLNIHMVLKLIIYTVYFINIVFYTV